MRINIKIIKEEFRKFFNLADYKEDEQEVIEQVTSGVKFRGPQLWILMFAILIASLGLNVNSTAVIIGAMLISPLMGPILGIGMSVGIYDFDLFKQSLKNYLVATGISVVTATVYFIISPLGEAQSELLARTSPTVFDVLIAFFGGAAGVLALTTKGKGQVIPGVAIATALMPPLCTAGYGLATWQLNYFLGAFYLYFINTVFIALSTFLGVKLLKFNKKTNVSIEREIYAKRVLMAVVLVTMIPAIIMTWSIVKKNVLNQNITSFVKNELQQPGTEILSTSHEHDTLQVVAVGREIDDLKINEAQHNMRHYSLEDYTLDVIQGSYQDSLSILATRINHLSATEATNRVLADQLNIAMTKLQPYEQLDSIALHICHEAEPLFPEVEDIQLGMLTDGERSTFAAFVYTTKGRTLNAATREKLITWLKARTGNEELMVRFEN